MAAIELSTYTKVGFALFGLGFLFHSLGYCSPFWHNNELAEYGHRRREYYGLWLYCREDQKYNMAPFLFCFSLVDGHWAKDYIQATQFFETIGFLSAIAAIILLLLGVCIEACKDRRILPIISSVVALGAAGCVILGCIIFGAKESEKHWLSWAFALSLVGGLFYAVAGIVVLVATLFVKRT